MIWELGTGPELWAEEFPRAAPFLRILDRDGEAGAVRRRVDDIDIRKISYQ